MMRKPRGNDKTGGPPARSTQQLAQPSNIVPTLDTKNFMYLRGKRDAVEGLDRIQVVFYSSGLIDISYGMQKDDSIVMMSAVDFHSEIAKAGKKKKEEWANGNDAAQGAIKKYYNRGLVVLPGDLTNGGLQTKVVPQPHPTALKTILGKSQSDFADAKLSTQSGILAHWNKMSADTRIAMDSFQKAVNPLLLESWTERLDRLTKEEMEKRERKAAKELAASRDGGTKLEPGRSTVADVLGEKDEPSGLKKEPKGTENPKGAGVKTSHPEEEECL